jgi:hypothetical protein
MKNILFVSVVFILLSLVSYSQTTKISISTNYQSGNTEATSLLLSGDTRQNLSEKIELSIGFRTSYAEQFGRVSDRTNRINFEIDSRGQLYPLMFVSAENDLNRRIDYRINGGIGAGYHFKPFGIDSKVSMMGLWESALLGDGLRISTPMLSFRYRTKIGSDTTARIRHVSMIQKYVNTSYYRMINTVSLVNPLISNINTLISFEHRYEKTQIEGVKPNDFSVTFGIEMDF